MSPQKKFNRKIEYPRVAFVFLVKNSKGFCEVTSKNFKKVTILAQQKLSK